jgi:hypothetical protein
VLGWTAISLYIYLYQGYTALTGVVSIKKKIMVNGSLFCTFNVYKSDCNIHSLPEISVSFLAFILHIQIFCNSKFFPPINLTYLYAHQALQLHHTSYLLVCTSTTADTPNQYLYLPEQIENTFLLSLLPSLLFGLHHRK